MIHDKIEYGDVAFVVARSFQLVNSTMDSKTMSVVVQHAQSIILELGENSLIVKFEAVGNDKTVGWSMCGCFWTIKQICITTSCLLIHVSIATEFLDKIVKWCQDVEVSDPLEVGCRLGLVACKGQYDTILVFLSTAVKVVAQKIEQCEEFNGGKMIHHHIHLLQQSSSYVGLMMQPSCSCSMMRSNLHMVLWCVPSNSFMTYCNEVELAWPVVLVDLQENGIRLVLIVIKCAEAIHQENGKPSDVLVRHVGFLVDFQSGSTREMETCLFEVLARRTNIFLKLVHFTATQFILVDFHENSLVCVIIFSKEQSVQWPTLLQAFSSRYGIPFSIQLCGIESLYQDNLVHLQELGWEVDKNACAKFVFSDFIVNSLKDRHTFMLYIFKDGVVAVNFKWGFHYLSAWSWVIKNVYSFVEGYKVMMLKVHDIVDEIVGDAMRILKYFGEYKHGRYSIQSKLGWDLFSEVWLAWYTQIAEYIAWEVKRSAQHYTKVIMDASILLKQLVIREQDKNCVVKLLDHLEHEDILLIFRIDPSKVSRWSGVLKLLVYFVVALTILVLAILKIFVWDPGLIWFSHFTTLRARRLSRGRICHVPRSKIRKKTEDALATVGYELLAVIDII